MGLGHSLSKAGNLEKPLARENEYSDAKNDVKNPKSEGARIQTEGSSSSPAAHSIVNKHGVSNLDSRLTQGISLVLAIDASRDLICQNIRRPALPVQFIEPQKCILTEKLNCGQSIKPGSALFAGANSKYCDKQVSSLTLEVVNGPSEGLSHTVQAESNSTPLLTLGRIPPSDMLLEDPEVSGKHVMINWNLAKHKWELVDMGSLNGTLVNSKSVHHPDIGSRKRGSPVELSSGDLITLGASRILVQIDSPAEHNIPFGVGVASDPMTMRRGRKKLPMEDVCYFQWPLSEISQFGVFGVCDGHCGADAAKLAGKLFPEVVAHMLADSTRREMVLSQQDASDVLRDSFSQVDASVDHYYEGCTATMLLVWADNRNNFMLQCANVGDSACIVSVNGNQVMMTEDHRIASSSEKQRMRDAGLPLRDDEKRLHGLNLGRMLGDRFLKDHEARFSSKPYISPVVRVDQTDKAVFALLASDGFWDVISASRAEQLVLEAREMYDGNNIHVAAGDVATFLVDQAKQMRTRDNTSVVFLDFQHRLKPSSMREH